jgi:hypothetical protein
VHTRKAPFDAEKILFEPHTLSDLPPQHHANVGLQLRRLQQENAASEIGLRFIFAQQKLFGLSCSGELTCFSRLSDRRFLSAFRDPRQPYRKG